MALHGPARWVNIQSDFTSFREAQCLLCMCLCSCAGAIPAFGSLKAPAQDHPLCHRVLFFYDHYAHGLLCCLGTYLSAGHFPGCSGIQPCCRCQMKDCLCAVHTLACGTRELSHRALVRSGCTPQRGFAFRHTSRPRNILSFVWHPGFK